MAIGRKLGVEFLKEGFRDTRAAPEEVAPRLDIARQRAFLTWGPALLRQLADARSGLSARALFTALRESHPRADFSEVQAAIDAAYEQRLIEPCGEDEFNDVLYAVTRLGRSVAPRD